MVQGKAVAIAINSQSRTSAPEVTSTEPAHVMGQTSTKSKLPCRNCCKELEHDIDGQHAGPCNLHRADNRFEHDSTELEHSAPFRPTWQAGVLGTAQRLLAVEAHQQGSKGNVRGD